MREVEGVDASKFLMNRIANSSNKFQGKYKRVLCVCSAGLLRSPSTALVLSQDPFNFNTRAAGIVPDFALVPVDQVLLEWADEIVCMDERQREAIAGVMPDKPVHNLKIPDAYAYRDPELLAIIRKRCEEVFLPKPEEK